MIEIDFKTLQSCCKFAGFFKIYCDHKDRKKVLPPFSALCNEKNCPVLPHNEQSIKVNNHG